MNHHYDGIIVVVVVLVVVMVMVMVSCSGEFGESHDMYMPKGM